MSITPDWNAFPWANWFTVCPSTISERLLDATYWRNEPKLDVYGDYWALNDGDIETSNINAWVERGMPDEPIPFLDGTPCWYGFELPRQDGESPTLKVHR